MPVEIKELVIRVVADGTNRESDSAAPTAASSDQQAALVEACVKQVLKILEKKKNR